MKITKRSIALPLIIAASCLFLATALFMSGIIPGYHLIWTRDVTGTMVGKRMSLAAPVYRYESDRSFEGNGYSFMVLEPGKDFFRWFDRPSEEFLDNYPVPPEYREGWRVMHYRRGPVAPDDKRLIDFALGYAAGKGKGLVEHQDALRETLGKDTTYYGAFYRMRGKEPDDIDLYAVDTAGGKIYMVNLDT